MDLAFSIGCTLQLTSFPFLEIEKQKNAGAVAIRNPYIRVVGLSVDENNAGRGKMSFTEEEEEQIVRLLRQPKIYDTLASSIAPSIYGEYTEGRVFFFFRNSMYFDE